MKTKKPAMTISMTERPTLTVDEFCELIGLSRSSAYKAMAAGDLKARKFGKRTFITREEWQRFVANLPRQTAAH